MYKIYPVLFLELKTDVEFAEKFNLNNSEVCTFKIKVRSFFMNKVKRQYVGARCIYTGSASTKKRSLNQNKI